MRERIFRLITLTFLWLFLTPLPIKPQDCPINQIVGTGSVFRQYIDCGGGHNCAIQVCGAGYAECCMTTGGYIYCTWCDEYYCYMITVNCV